MTLLHFTLGDLATAGLFFWAGWWGRSQVHKFQVKRMQKHSETKTSGE